MDGLPTKGVTEGETLPSGADATPALDPSLHELKPNAIGLLQSTVIGIASSAPGQATALAMAAIIVASAYGGGTAILITMLPMLAIAIAYQRLNMWEQNCGASYVWVGRAVNPYLGFLVGWVMLAGYVLGTVSDILPLGPSILYLVGANPDSQWGNVISATILGGAVTLVSIIGIQLSARFQMAIAVIEYAILIVFAVIGFFAVFVNHAAGTVHPTLAWLSPTGVGGKGSLVAGMLVAVYLFTGWDTSIYLNEETERKEINPGRAAIIAVLVLGVFYALLVVTLQGAASAAQMEAHSSSALVFAANQLVGSPWDKFMALAISLSVIGTTQAFLIGTARIAYSMGSDHVIAKRFGTVSRRFRTPAFGTAVFGILTIIITWLYVFSSSVSGAFDIALTSVGVLFALFYAFTGFATTWYYRKLLGRSLKDAIVVGALPLAGAVVLLYIAVKSIAGFTGEALWSMVGIGILGLALMAVGALVYKSPFFKLKTTAYDPGDSPVRKGA